MTEEAVIPKPIAGTVEEGFLPKGDSGANHISRRIDPESGQVWLSGLVTPGIHVGEYKVGNSVEKEILLAEQNGLEITLFIQDGRKISHSILGGDVKTPILLPDQPEANPFFPDEYKPKTVDLYPSPGSELIETQDRGAGDHGPRFRFGSYGKSKLSSIEWDRGAAKPHYVLEEGWKASEDTFSDEERGIHAHPRAETMVLRHKTPKALTMYKDGFTDEIGQAYLVQIYHDHDGRKPEVYQLNQDVTLEQFAGSLNRFNYYTMDDFRFKKLLSENGWEDGRAPETEQEMALVQARVALRDAVLKEAVELSDRAQEKIQRTAEEKTGIIERHKDSPLLKRESAQNAFDPERIDALLKAKGLPTKPQDALVYTVPNQQQTSAREV